MVELEESAGGGVVVELESAGGVVELESAGGGVLEEVGGGVDELDEDVPLALA